MGYQVASKGQIVLREVKTLVGGARLYDADYVHRRCELAYGGEIAPRTWWVWRRSVEAENDHPLGGVTEATYLLLLTKASMLRGNADKSSGDRAQVPIERLAEAVRAIVRGDRPWDVPPTISYADLKRLVELRSLRTYADRYLRSHGLRRSQPTYSRAEALQILSKFPDYSHVFNSASETVAVGLARASA
jgi:hypothetical protein